MQRKILLDIDQAENIIDDLNTYDIKNFPLIYSKKIKEIEAKYLLTPQMHLYWAKAYFYEGNYGNAINELKQAAKNIYESSHKDSTHLNAIDSGLFIQLVSKLQQMVTKKENIGHLNSLVEAVSIAKKSRPNDKLIAGIEIEAINKAIFDVSEKIERNKIEEGFVDDMGDNGLVLAEKEKEEEVPVYNFGNTKPTQAPVKETKTKQPAHSKPSSSLVDEIAQKLEDEINDTKFRVLNAVGKFANLFDRKKSTTSSNETELTETKRPPKSPK